MELSRRAVPALLVLILGSWVAGYGGDVMLVRSGTTLRANSSQKNNGYIFRFSKQEIEDFGRNYLVFAVEVWNFNSGNHTFNGASGGEHDMVLKMEKNGKVLLGNARSNVTCFLQGEENGDLYLTDDGRLVVKKKP